MHLLTVFKILFGVGILGALLPVPPALAQTPWGQTSGPEGGTVTRLVNIQGVPFAALYSGGIYKLGGNTWQQIAIHHGMQENRIFDMVADPQQPTTLYAAQMIGCMAKSEDAGTTWVGLCDAILAATKGDNFSSFTLALDPEDSKTIYLPGHGHDQNSILLVSHDKGTTWNTQYDFKTHYDFNHLTFYQGRMYLSTREHGIFSSSDKGASWQAFNGGLSSPRTNHMTIFKGRLYLEGGTLWQYNVRAGGLLFRLNKAATGWERVKGPTRVTGTGTDGTTLWVGGEDEKIWYSRNGTNFTKARAKGLKGGWVGEMLVQGKTLYAGMRSNGIFRSTDGGTTFNEFNNGLTSIATREVYVNPRNADHIYVGSWDRLGMYVSHDAGKTYRRVGIEHNILTLAPDPQNFDHIYAGGDYVFLEGVFKKDKVAWTQRTKPGPKKSVIKALAVHPQNPLKILAGVAEEAAEGPNGHGLWYSENQGKTWQRAPGIGDHAVHAIIFNPQDPHIVWAAALGGGVYKSTDSGHSFTRLSDERLKYTYRMAMDPQNPQHLIAGSQLFFAGFSAEDQISGRYGGLFETMDEGATWKDLVGPIRNYDGDSDPKGFQGWLYNFGHLVNYEQILIDPRNSAHIIVGHHGESVVSTFDGGATWEKQSQGMIPGDMHNYAYCLGQSSTGDRVFACTCGRGLFRGESHASLGSIAWEYAGLGPEDAEQQLRAPANIPHNAPQARTRILTPDYFHTH